MINQDNIRSFFVGVKLLYKKGFDGTTSHYEKIAMTTKSSSREEEYGWLGQFPALREWSGDRIIKNLQAHGFAIRNRKFESTVEVDRDNIADDTYGIYAPMFSEMGRTAKQHPDSLVFDLLKNGFATKCYDGQNYFDADHPLDGNPASNSPSVSNLQAGSGPAWFLLDTTRTVKPIIWQEREGYEFQALDSFDDREVFMRETFLYGIRARVNCGFGLWQLAFASKAELTPENFATARSAMMNFKGDTGQLLGVSPNLLIVPPSLEAAGRQLILADTISGSSNIWRGAAELLVTHYVA